MEKYGDFRQVLVDLVGKRVRICFTLVESDHIFQEFGWIREVNQHTLSFKSDLTKGAYPVTKSHLNLEGLVIYSVDEIPENADLSLEAEKPSYVGEATEYIPYDKDGKPVREPQEGYVILHKDHIYAKGTVYTKLPKRGEVGETEGGDKEK